MLVSDIMNQSPVWVAPEDSLRDAARLLLRRNVGALPVVSADGRLRGVVTDRDIVLRGLALGKDPDATPVRDCMSRGVQTVSPGETLGEAAAKMAAHQVRRLPALENGRLVGMLSLADLTRCGDYAMEAAQALCEISTNIRRL